MITVAILINGNPIMARSAVNKREFDDKGRTKYEVDTGDVIWHDPAIGAVELAQLMLKTIKREP